MESNFERLCKGKKISWSVKQVSTHGHDRPVKASFLTPWMKEFESRGLHHRDSVTIPPSSEYEFPMLDGPGMIVNMWFSFTPYKLRGIAFYNRSWAARKKIRLRIYFDGEETPSVDVPIGDFFGVGFGEYKEFRSKYLEETSGGYVCRFPMPYREGARIVIFNSSPNGTVHSFYGAITYRQQDKNENGGFLRDPYYFHAKYREELPTTPKIPYKILDVEGNGFYAGTVLNLSNATRGRGFTFLEGNTKFYIDGEDEPSLEYTGTEDLFQGAWYYTNCEFNAPYSGLTIRSFASKGPVRTFIYSKCAINKASQYRFHELDAIPFKKSLLSFIHHGEFDEVPTNQSSVTYVYAKHPVKINLKPLKHGEFKDEYYTK